MQNNLDQVIEIIKTLPIEDYDKLRAVIDNAERAKQQNFEGNLSDDQKRMKKSEKWLEENRVKYLNQWVCLYGDQLIASGKDALEVDRKAIEAGIEAPFLEHIVEEEFPFGGW
jgi:hypothetical protein